MIDDSMDAVFEAYGEPEAEEYVDDLFGYYRDYVNRTLYRNDRFARLWYRDIGLAFWFEEDRIKEIVVFRI